MESVSSSARKATETEGIFKLSNTREAYFKRNDESSTVVDQENGLLRSEWHLIAPEEHSDNSLWAYVSIILCYIRMKTLPFINVRSLKNRFVGLSFPIFKVIYTVTYDEVGIDPKSHGF